MKAGIVVFPGTNCDKDTKRACEFLGWQTEYIWHDDKVSNNFDVIFLAGGFSYGDYIRSGALASFSPVVESLKSFNGFIVGICNGFQILCETRMLNGALTINTNNQFMCDEIEMSCNHPDLPDSLALPIANKEGRYYSSTKIDESLILFKYKNNPNGSIQDIAGIYNKDKKIIGMMPHPERAIFEELGNTEGRAFFKFLEKEINAI